MTPAGNHAWRQIGAYGTDNRRFARTLVISLVVHGILAWLLLYHLDQFIPVPPTKAYLVELMTPISREPEPQPARTEEVVIPQPHPQPEPVMPLPQPVRIEPPPPQKVPVTPPPPPSVVTTKVQPELSPPKSLNRTVPRTPSAVPQLNESTPSPLPAQRDVALTTPTVSKQPMRRPESHAALPPDQTLPSARKSQDVDTPRSELKYQPARQSVQETLPEQSSGGLVPTTATRGDVTIPDSPSRRPEPRSSRTDAPLPADNRQPLPTRTSDTTIVSPRGPASVQGKVSSATKSDSLPVSSSSFAPAPAGNTSVPLPGASGPAVTVRQGRENSGGAIPSGKTPILQTSTQAMVDQTSLAAFRSLKTCLDTEQENRLKTTLAVLLEGDVSCTSGGSRYFFAATETSYSLQVGIATGAGPAFKDRCDALQQAVRCVEQSRK